MSEPLKNAKTLFSNARVRVIIFFTFFIVIAAIATGLFGFRHKIQAVESKAELKNAPQTIESVPGGFNPTKEYAHLQETDNKVRAQQAFKKGTSAIPTLVRSSELTDKNNIKHDGNAGIGFDALSRLEHSNEKIKGFSEKGESGATTRGGNGKRGVDAQRSTDNEGMNQHSKAGAAVVAAGGAAGSSESAGALDAGNAYGPPGSLYAKNDLSHLSDSPVGAGTSELEHLRKEQMKRMAVQDRKRTQQRIQQTMNSHASQLVSTWGPSGAPKQGYVAGNLPTNKQRDTRESAGDRSSSQGPVYIKAGTMLFARLITAINTDEPGPVLATVVSGRFKGAGSCWVP